MLLKGNHFHDNFGWRTLLRNKGYIGSTDCDTHR